MRWIRAGVQTVEKNANLNFNVFPTLVSGVRRYIYDGIDPVQRASLNEMCYAVDEEDKIIGTLSKKDCHLVQGDGYLPLHRAFSVYVFNNKGEFLMQKRASTKVSNLLISFETCYIFHNIRMPLIN